MPPARPRPGAMRRRSRAASLGVAAATLLAVVPAAHADAPALGGPASCRPAGKPDQARVALIVDRARAGVVVGPAAIDPPSLPRGRPAQVAVRLGPDPLGIATTLGVDPAAFWRSAGAQVTASGPKLGARARIRSDGSATLSFTPPEPGGIVVRMYVSGHAIQAALGLCSAPVSGVGAPLLRPGGVPGSPVLRVEDVPEPPPDPGEEPSPGPVPVPTPGPEPTP